MSNIDDTYTRTYLKKVIKDALDKIDVFKIGTNEGKAEIIDKEMNDYFITVCRARVKSIAREYAESLESGG